MIAIHVWLQPMGIWALLRKFCQALSWPFRNLVEIPITAVPNNSLSDRQAYQPAVELSSMGLFRPEAPPTFEIAPKDVTYGVAKRLDWLDPGKVQIAWPAVAECGIQLVPRRSGDNLVNLGDPTWADIYRNFEHTDRDNVRVIEAIERPSIELFSRGDANAVETVDRALPNTANNVNDMDRSGSPSEELMDGWYLDDPSSSRAEPARLGALHAAAVARAAIVEPDVVPRVNTRPIQPAEQIVLQALRLFHRLEI
jgi:hypothetical protein